MHHTHEAHRHFSAQQAGAALPPMTGRQLLAFAKLLKGKTGRKRPVALIVEDQPFGRKVLQSTLQGICEVHCAPNAMEGWQVFLSTYPDVVFMETALPDLDGLVLSAAIKRIAPDAVIMIVTAQSTVNHVRAALASGADGYIIKPFNKAKILHCMEKFRIHKPHPAMRRAS